MQNQKSVSISFINFNQFRSVLSLYLFTIGTCLLGFSTYLILETFGYSSQNLTSWSGESLFSHGKQNFYRTYIKYSVYNFDIIIFFSLLSIVHTKHHDHIYRSWRSF